MRISIMAGVSSSRPDTLTQTEQQPISKNPLADGAGHTFLKAASCSAVAAFGFLGRGAWIDQRSFLKAS